MAPRNRITAAILAIFTGFFGGHKLYLRDGSGFMTYFFILIFVGGIFRFPITAMLGIFDAFKLFGMTDEEFNRKYNKGIVRPRNPVVDRRRNEQLRRYQLENVKRGYEPLSQKRSSIRHNPFKKSGIAKYKDFDLEGAIEDFNKGLDIHPNDISLHFNLACAYSLTEKKERSFKHLAKAVALGFNDFDRILNHDDLAFLRIQPEFDAFKKRGFTDPPLTRSNAETEFKTADKTDDVLLSQLNRLDELRKKGILTENEFQMEKKKLMRP